MKDKSAHTIHIYDKIALAYQNRFMDLDLYDASFDRFCSLLPQDTSRVLSQ